jgi:hypothetical protein
VPPNRDAVTVERLVPPPHVPSLSLHDTVVNGPPHVAAVKTPSTVSVAVVPGADAWHVVIVYVAVTEGVNVYQAVWEAVAQNAGSPVAVAAATSTCAVRYGNGPDPGIATAALQLSLPGATGGVASPITKYSSPCWIAESEAIPVVGLL